MKGPPGGHFCVAAPRVLGLRAPQRHAGLSGRLSDLSRRSLEPWALPTQVSLTGGGLMRGGDEYKASVVGFDEDKDVAVLKINVEDSKVGFQLKPVVSLERGEGETWALAGALLPQCVGSPVEAT